MAKEVILPKFGFTVEESTIVEWLVSDGDFVEEGDPLCEVTTDKVNMEVEAPSDGVIAGIQYPAGETVPVTEVICYILAAGESLPNETPSSTKSVSQPSEINLPRVKATPLAERMAAVEGIDLSQVKRNDAGDKITRQDVEQYITDQQRGSGKVRATPAARNLAHQHGLTLGNLNGTGPRGRIQANDISLALEKIQVAPTASDAEIIPYTGMRQTIGQRLQQAWQTIPHILFSLDADMSRCIQLRQEINQDRKPDNRVSLTAMLVKILAFSLHQHPRLNAHFTEEGIHLVDAVNLGIAVALDDGLIVPVVHQAHSQGIEAIGKSVKDLSHRARSGKLRAGDLKGGTFTLSNLGMYGIDHFTAIINPPEVGILAIGRVKQRFVPDSEGLPVALPMMTMTLAVDHRAIDGAVAAQFLQSLQKNIEEPGRMLL